MSLYFLFAPVFRESGARVASTVAERQTNPIVHGLYTGLDGGHEAVGAVLGAKAGMLWSLPELERTWLDAAPTDQQMQEISESYPAGTLGRIVTADRRVGSGFVRNATLRPDPVARAIGALGPAAPQRYAANCLLFAEESLKATSPRLVFFYVIASAPALALALAAEKLNIRYQVLKHSRIADLHFLDADYRGNSRGFIDQYSSGGNKGKTEATDFYSQAESLVSSYRQSPSAQNYVPSRREKALVKIMYVLAHRVTKLLLVSGNSWRVWQARRKVYESLCELRRWFLLRKKSSPVPDSDYLYFPLHVDPESSTMVLSPDSTDQVDIIEAIAKALPPGVLLVVKEHLPMIGFRRSQFYSTLKKFPGVVVVDARASSFDLIRRSKAVVTITGSAGHEALLLKKPVVLLGEAPYSRVGSGVIESTRIPSSLAFALKSALTNEGPREQDLCGYVAELLRSSFPLDHEFIWGKNQKQSDLDSENVRNLAQAIEAGL